MKSERAWGKMASTEDIYLWGLIGLTIYSFLSALTQPSPFLSPSLFKIHVNLGNAYTVVLSFQHYPLTKSINYIISALLYLEKLRQANSSYSFRKQFILLPLGERRRKESLRSNIINVGRRHCLIFI